MQTNSTTGTVTADLFAFLDGLRQGIEQAQVIAGRQVPEAQEFDTQCWLSSAAASLRNAQTLLNVAGLGTVGTVVHNPTLDAAYAAIDELF